MTDGHDKAGPKVTLSKTQSPGTRETRLSVIPGSLPAEPLSDTELDSWLSDAGHRSSGLWRLGISTIPGLALVASRAMRSLVFVAIAIVLIFVILPVALMAART